MNENREVKAIKRAYIWEGEFNHGYLHPPSTTSATPYQPNEAVLKGSL